MRVTAIVTGVAAVGTGEVLAAGKHQGCEQGKAEGCQSEHAGKVVLQRQLLREVWGPQYEKETHYLRIYLGQLRRKLEPDPANPALLLTEPGIGYRLEILRPTDS